MHMGKNMKIGVCTINYVMSFICSGMDTFQNLWKLYSLRFELDVIL